MTAHRTSGSANVGTSGENGRFWRNVGKWSVAFLFFLTLTAKLISLQLFQVTSEGTSKRTLRRAVAALSEIDPLLDRNYPALREEAAGAGPGDSLRLRDFPVDVALTPDEVRNSSQQQLREILLDHAADAMYAHGSGVLRESDVNTREVGTFTIAGATSDSLGILRSRNHEIFGVMTFMLAALCAVLGVTLAALSRGFGRLASVGAVVLAATLPLLLAAIGIRFYMRIISAADNEYVQHEALSIGQGLAWIPIRDGLAFTALGLAFLVLGWGCAIWADRQPSFEARGTAAR